MDLLDHLRQARVAHTEKAKQRRASAIYRLSWRSTGWHHIVGLDAVAKYLGVAPSTVAVRLSQHKNKWHVKRTHPETGDYDVVTVSKVTMDQVPELKKRGRKALFQDPVRLGEGHDPNI